MDDYGQTSIDHPSFDDDAVEIGTILDQAGIAFWTYAATGSSYGMAAIDARLFHGRIHGLGPQGIGPMTRRGIGAVLLPEAAQRLGIEPGDLSDLEPADDYTLWVVKSHRTGAAWLERGHLHDPGYLASHLPYPGDNAVDITAIAAMINRVELARATYEWGGGNLAELERERRIAIAGIEDRAPLLEADPS